MHRLNRFAFAILFVPLLLLALPACASALDLADSTTMVTGAATLSARDALRAEKPALRARFEAQAIAAHPDDRDAAADEYRRLAHPLETASAAVDTAISAWATLYAALSAWEAGTGDHASWQRAAFCAASSVLSAIRGFEAVGLDVPPLLARARRDLTPFADQMCALTPSGSARGATPAATSAGDT